MSPKRPIANTPAVTDLPWTIPTPAGDVTVTIEGDRYRIRGPSGEHSIGTEPWNTDRARLVAHVSTFVEVNGGTFTAPPDPNAPKGREKVSSVAARVRIAVRKAREEGKEATAGRGGIVRARMAEVLLLDDSGERLSDAIDHVWPSAIRGGDLTRWRKAAKAAGAARIVLQGDVAWAQTFYSAEEEPLDGTWAIYIEAGR